MAARSQSISSVRSLRKAVSSSSIKGETSKTNPGSTSTSARSSRRSSLHGQHTNIPQLPSSDYPLVVLVRHAEAEHNVKPDYTLRDALLTDLGKRQSSAMKTLYPGLGQYLTHYGTTYVSSGLRRAMQTALLGFPYLSKLHLWPEVVEVNAHPCNTGSPLEVIQNTFKGEVRLDYSKLKGKWYPKEGELAFTPAAQEARAIKARQEMKRMPTRMVVCVSHLGFLPQLAFDRPYNKDDKWDNAEPKIFRFDETDKSGRARLIRLSLSEEKEILGTV